MKSKIRFKFLTGDVNWLDYGGKWISQRFNNGEFDWWFVLTLDNVEDRVGEREAKEVGAKYWVTVAVVAPEEFSDKEGAVEGMGDEYTWDKLTPEMKVELVEQYAGGAQVFHAAGNNYKKLFKEARQKATESEFLFGFAMDRAMNAIGSTGWDFLKGDITAGLRRYAESGKSDDPKMNLMKKLTK